MHKIFKLFILELVMVFIIFTIANGTFDISQWMKELRLTAAGALTLTWLGTFVILLMHGELGPRKRKDENPPK